jgi:hypothetical protein
MPVAAVSGGRPSGTGVAERALGNEVPAVKAELPAIVDDDDRAARDLAAGTGGRNCIKGATAR